MSKLYNKYLKLKNENKNVLYLFEAGTFYYALGEDAELINKLFGYKILAFGKQTIKSAFPKNTFENRKKFFELNNIEYKIIDNDHNNNISDLSAENAILNEIKNIDFNNISPLMAFNKLLLYQKKLNNII